MSTSEIKLIDFHSPLAAREFVESLQNTGFAVMTKHGITPDLINENYSAWRAFFNSDHKRDFAFDNKTHDGYVAQDLSETAKGAEKKDLKEFFHYYTWGRCPPELQTCTQSLQQSLTQMAMQLLEWIEDFSPLKVTSKFSEPLFDMIRDSNRTLFRLIHYPPLHGDEPEGAMRSAAHEDINLITLMPAATAQGLQMKTQQGQWVDVPIDPHWIVVNTGDMLQECSDFFFPSATHRVVNPSGDAANQSRLAMSYYLHPRDNVRLSRRYTAQSYRLERWIELGLN